MLKVLDLFSGIGGFSLGLERTGGFETVAFCEIEPYCRKVLNKHWPKVPIYNDIKEIMADTKSQQDRGIQQFGVWPDAGAGSHWVTDGTTSIGPIDVICGGFPCQDISVAGKGAGIEGERSGLWKEYARLIGELRPRYVIVENVAALLGRGLQRVLGDLASVGYDAEWHCIPASAVGAPHRRDRLWIVAYPQRQGQGWRGVSGHGEDQKEVGKRTPSQSERTGQDVAYPNGKVVEGQWLASRIQEERSSFSGTSWWLTEPNVGRVVNGIPSRMDQLKALGNAVVPQIPELIGNAILAAEAKKAAA